MNFDKVNRWLTLLANIGVLIGLAILIVEVNQSNRIATYAAENARRTMFFEQNLTMFESIDAARVAAKLADPGAQLEGSDAAQAQALALAYVNIWFDTQVAHSRGLLAEGTLDATLYTIDVTFDMYPGLAPYFSKIILPDGPKSPVAEKIRTLLRERVQGYEGSARARGYIFRIGLMTLPDIASSTAWSMSAKS